MSRTRHITGATLVFVSKQMATQIRGNDSYFTSLGFHVGLGILDLTPFPSQILL